MRKWRFISLSMPVLVILLFFTWKGGPARNAEKDVEPLFALQVSENLPPQWGVIRDRISLVAFMGKHFPEEAVPEIDFDGRRVLFLVNGPEGGHYAGFRIHSYREDPDGGITVFCEREASSPSGQLVGVPRFEGEAVFFFR